MRRRLGVEPLAQGPRQQRIERGGQDRRRRFAPARSCRSRNGASHSAALRASASSDRSGHSSPSAWRRNCTRLRNCSCALLHGSLSMPSATMPSASNVALSASGATGLVCSASTSAPSRRERRARSEAEAASKVTASRSSILPAKRASISASVIGAARTMRLAAAAPVNSATARNGSRASAEAASTLPPRPLASRNAPRRRRDFWRCGRDRRAPEQERRGDIHRPPLRSVRRTRSGSSPPLHHRARLLGAARAVAAELIEPVAQIDIVAAQPAFGEHRGDRAPPIRRRLRSRHRPPCAPAAAATAARASVGPPR